ncbi:MAG: hypothetical protein IPM85_13625 [Chitinophagaceae bacterium]|nr:hypothetical protein [Chitinophagaceae bacterium]
MKRTFILLLSSAVILLTGYFTLEHRLFQRSSGIESEINKEENEEKEKETGAEKQLMMWFQSKGYPNPNNLSGKYQAAWQQYLEIKEKNFI